MPRKKVPPEPRDCAHSPISFVPEKKRDQKYCTKECRDAAERARRKADNPTLTEQVIALKGRACSNSYGSNPNCGKDDDKKRFATAWPNCDDEEITAEEKLRRTMLLCYPCFKEKNRLQAKHEAQYRGWEGPNDFGTYPVEAITEWTTDAAGSPVKKKPESEDLRQNVTCGVCGKYGLTVSSKDGSLKFSAPFKPKKFRWRLPPLDLTNCPQCLKLDGVPRVQPAESGLELAA